MQPHSKWTGSIWAPASSLVALLAPLLLATGAHAADSRVQLQVFQIRVVDNTGKQGQIPITVFIDTPNSRSAQAICSVGPRVRDALTTHFRKETYPMDKQNKVDTVSMATKARPVIEDAVKKENVTGVVVSMDPPKVSAAASDMFARMGCMGVGDQDDEKKAAKKK